MKQQDLFDDISFEQNNPLRNRRVGFIGKFKNRATLIKRAKEFGASEKSKEGLTRDTQILVLGENVKQEDQNRLLCYEHDGWKPLKISEAELLEIFKGHYLGLETAPTPIKQVSIDMSYYNWTPPVTSVEEGEEDTGTRCSSPLVYGEENPLYGKEIFVPNSPDTDIGIIRQLIGNYGGYANADYYDDTNIVMLSDATLEKLKQGIKDEVILYIENRYNRSNTKMFNIQFTSVGDFINWVKVRIRQFPDESTIELLSKYQQ